jgi:Na+/H+ antiporter NhaD/arsenite permease-like protein
MSSFLDNIAAAMIGGTIARFVFKGKVHIGFLAAIVAASNAGGAWSVVGDTTTTLMWIDGVSVFVIFRAIIASTVALFVFGIFASKQQDKHCRIVKDAPKNLSINWKKLTVVAMILIGAILTNFLLDFPAIGVWIAILVGAMFINTPWVEVKHSLKGTIFLLALVSCASLMPVDDLPPASMWSAFALGFISAVFDNIPLTKLCLVQGGYDWGVLAYSVGFGGSMIWFGSSAGVALSNMYPEAKDVLKYVKHGWHVTLAYVVGFFVMIALIGWHAPDSHKQFEIKIHQLPQMPVENTNQTIESH